MFPISDIQKDYKNIYDLDSLRLDKLVKALVFVSEHIRQSGDKELADRVENAAYEILLSAYKGKHVFDHISGYVVTLLSLSIQKEFLSASAQQVFVTGIKSVFSKRQNAKGQDTEIDKILELDKEDNSHIKDTQAKSEETEIRKSPAPTLASVKKDKIELAPRQTKQDDKRQSSRRVEIMKALSSEPVSIKDIAVHVEGCSEKTIQRELNAMVDEGVVRRVGEKRWSKYVLR